MIEVQKETRLYLQAEAFSEIGLVCHGFTSALGGVSKGKIKGLNLGFRVEDDPESVRENYRLVGEDLGLRLEHTVLAKQTHTDTIRIVTKEDVGKGLFRESDIEDTDGLMTNLSEIPLVVFSADCVPLLFLDPKKKVIAAIHAGWRGTVKGIGKKAVDLMQERFSCDPKDILVAIGPSIGPCCFTFDEKDAGVFPKECCRATDNGKVLVDIWEINRRQLIEKGIQSEHITLAEICTVCHADRFYSYRTHKANTGRQGAVIMLK